MKIIIECDTADEIEVAEGIRILLHIRLAASR